MPELYSNSASENIPTADKFQFAKSRSSKNACTTGAVVHLPEPGVQSDLNAADTLGEDAHPSAHGPTSPKTPRRQRSSHLPVYGGVGTVGEVIGRSRPTVFRWVKAGLIPAPFKLKGCTQNLWDIAEVIASLENNAARGG